MDAHLVGIPGLGTLTVRSLTGGDLKVLGRKADGTLDAQGLGLGTLNELRAHLLEGGDLARGEGDADLVNLGAFAEFLVWVLLVRHLDDGAVEGPAELMSSIVNCQLIILSPSS